MASPILTLQYIEPDMLHPHSDITVAEVATYLEKRYHLLERFTLKYKDAMLKRIAKEILRNTSKVRVMGLVEQFIQDSWRDFINEEQHGIKSKAAQQRGDVAFIDSGAYFKNLRVRIDWPD